MSRVLRTTVLLLLAIGGTAVAAFAQGLPTSQPGLLYLIREEVKVGRPWANAATAVPPIASSSRTVVRSTRDIGHPLLGTAQLAPEVTHCQ